MNQESDQRGFVQAAPVFWRGRIISEWLFVMAGLLVIMTLIGGATRLTDSGLSITKWAPLTGIIPPLTQSDWDEAFADYREIPQYKSLNSSMKLDEFKTIYWWEWGHRAFGRFLGVVFLLPFIFFLWRRWIPPVYIAQFLGIFALGAVQGLVGWLMVRSGLSGRVDVNPLQLALHLGIAILIYGWIVALALRFWYEPATRPPFRRDLNEYILLASGWVILGLVFMQIILGALVSGSDAGLIYNHWPGMREAVLLPANLDNPAFIQWMHRIGAWIVFIASLIHALYCWLYASRLMIAHSALILAGIIVIQAVLGILTLIYVIPLPLALAHQIGGLLVWTAVITHLHIVYLPLKNMAFGHQIQN